MATISETLQIQDRFSSAMSAFNSLGARMSTVLGEQNNKLGENAQKHAEASRKTREHGDQAKRTSGEMQSLAQVAARVGAALGGIAGVRAFVGLSDSLTQTTARLNAIKGEFAEVADLQDEIFAAAQRSRGSYMDMAASVASLKAQTGEVFASTAEAVRFTELLNKQFAISGTSASGVESTMYNLTQALATGVLRGNDLQMVLSNAPALVQKIGDYMGVSVGEIRKLAQEGKITADIVKNAIMGAGEDIDEAFEKMPLTFGQAVQKLKNKGVRAMQPLADAFTRIVNSEGFEEAMNGIANGIAVLASIGEAAMNVLVGAFEWARNNMSLLAGVAAAVAVAFILLKVTSVGAAIASGAAWMMAHLPIVLLAAVVGLAIGLFLHFGGTVQQIGAFVGGVFGFIYAVGHNAFAGIWNIIASFAEFFANVWSDPLGATVRLFADVFDAILGMVEAVANAIDALTGSNLAGAVSGFRGMISGWVDENFGENAIQIERMANIDTKTAMLDFSLMGGQLGAKIDGLGDKVAGLTDGLGDFNPGEFGGIAAGSTGTGGGKANVGTVDKVKDVSLSDEDMKIYRDLAERRYMANVELQTLAPNISVSIPESAAKNLTSQDIADKLKVMLIDQAAAHTAVAHAH